MATPLFRQGFIDSQQQPTLQGTLLLPVQGNLTLLAAISLLLLLLLILFLAFGSYTRKAQLQGIILPAAGLFHITSPRDGYVQRLMFHEGETVSPDATLLQLSTSSLQGIGDDNLQAQRDSLARQLQHLVQQLMQEQTLMQLQQQHSELHRQQLLAERVSADHTLTLARQRSALLKRDATRFQQLHQHQFVSTREREQQQLMLNEAQLAETQLHQQKQRLERELIQLDTSQLQQNQQFAIRRETLLGQQALLQQQQLALAAQGESHIRAPVAGQVAALLVKAGESVRAGERLLTLLPADAQLQAELYAPSSAVGFIQPGQRVGLRLNAFPHEKFGIQWGKVQTMTLVSLQAGDVLPRQLATWQRSEAHYRIVVALDSATLRAYGRDEPLRPGMTLSGAVELEQRYLWEWLLEPLWALRGNL